jgi:hypothetical protein
MSARIQRQSPEITQTTVIKARVAEVDFFVNIYMDKDGNVEQGSRTFRQERNAINHGVDTANLEYIGTRKFTVRVEG